jgi:hypothetical protein
MTKIIKQIELFYYTNNDVIVNYDYCGKIKICALNTNYKKFCILYFFFNFFFLDDLILVLEIYCCKTKTKQETYY